jgi:4-hydroxybenzoate polyprenyltransferase
MKTVPLKSIDFWQAYLIQMRPYLFFVSGIAGLAGMASYSEFTLFNINSLLLFLAFFLSYGFGQALTDCYQTDTDEISAPYRPLSNGTLSIYHVKMISIIGLLSVSTILIYNNLINLPLCLLSVAGLWTYSYVKKRFWFAGPFYNAWIVGILALIGYFSSIKNTDWQLIDPVIVKVILVTFFSYTNFVLIGYLKDIAADKETDYRTFPVVFGWIKTTWVGDVILLISALIYYFYFLTNVPSIFFGCFALIVGIAGQLFAHLTHDKSEKNSAFPVLSTVRTFVLWHCGIICSFHPGLTIFCIIFFIAFEFVVYFRPMTEQI